MGARKIWSLIFPVSCLVLLAGSCAGDPFKNPESNQLPEIVDYNFQVQPILSDRCYRCHGPDENARQANLRLDIREGLFGKTESGKIPVKPGDPGSSEIMDRITSNEPDYVMPPPDAKLSLDELEIATLEKWISQGAEWKPHWSFIPPEKPELPKISTPEWAKNEIDHFILSKLEQNGLSNNPEAHKEVLLRRVTLDLTGLPPTIEEIDNFLEDDTPDAYEKVVDRLLSSPHYGEHMAVDWLDLARYADTHGYQADFYRPHWPWRDWVVQALNINMPYDEFVSWQLAGDLYPDATKEQILATGFNRNHAQNNEGGIVEEEFRVEYVADRTQTFGTAFLGLTMQCARCHDHKYDPVSQKEFYQLFSFFNNVAESGQTTFYQPDMPGPTLLLPEEAQVKQIEYIEKITADKENQLKEYLEQQFVHWGDKQIEIPDQITKGLIAHYALENVRNDKLINSVPNGKHGRIIDPVYSKLAEDPPQVVPGKVGTGLRLTGDDALSFPGTGRFDRTDPFTIGLWIKVPADLEKGVIFHSNKGSALYTYKGYQVSIEEGRFDVRLAHNFPYNSIHLLSGDAIPRNQWIHLLLSYDGSSKASGTKLYLNGKVLQLAVVQDNLYKDIVFHPEQGSDKPSVDQHLKVGARWRGKGFTGGEVDEVKVYARNLTPLEIWLVSGKKTENLDQRPVPFAREIFDLYTANFDQTYSDQLKEIKALRQQYNDIAESIFEVMVMDEMPEARTAFVLDRGIYNQRGAAVMPGTPKAVMEFNNKFPPTRFGLSQWLFDAKNPLPARVAVNRFWQHYFGTGMVKTVEDFGSQGQRPSHPELLDWLAVSFRESGWDVKYLQRMIVLSATYRQSSVADKKKLSIDPGNKWLARGPSSRLTAESLRDLVLAASGLLTPKMGGPSVKPYQPDGLWSYNAFSAKYEQSHGEDLYRRSLYTFWKRTNPPPSMNIFDAPSRSYCVVNREKTATPLQALVLLNDPQFVEAARVLAQRVMKNKDETEARITLGYRLLTGQTPRHEQVELLAEQLSRAIESTKQKPDKLQALLTVGEYPLDKKLDATELVAYTRVMSTIMNFDATTMRR